MIHAVRGTYDVLPGDIEIWHAVEAPEYFLAPLGDAAFDYATLLATRLRAKGKRVYLDFDGRSLKSQMRLADKLQAKGVLIIGDEELKSGTLVLRDMATKEQRNVREEDLA